MRLIEALRYTEPICVSFVGGGGKTTALFYASREIVESAALFPRKTVLISTTTHLGDWQTKYADHFRIVSGLGDIDKLHADLPQGVVLVTGEAKSHRLSGLNENLLEKLSSFAIEQLLPLLIEADGAHQRPLKAPAAHEPVIPAFTRHVVVVAGLGGLGKPLTSDWVHRPEIFGQISGLKPGELITDEALAKVLLAEQGGLKSIPSGARKSVLLNQADTPDIQLQARKISDRLISPYDACIIASLASQGSEIVSKPGQEGDRQKVHAVIEPVAGILLAAGGSRRLGLSKQLLTWKGVPFIRHVAMTALNAGLSPLIAVVGHRAEHVSQALKDLPLRIVNNTQWQDGMSTSIRTGIQSLPADIGAVVFLQCDQPQVPQALIHSLVKTHQSTMHPIIAPQIDGQRGNPVLFDAVTFAQLQALQGDVGGRALFSQFPVHWMSWQDANLLLDIDTPEDYQRFLKIYATDEVKK